MADTSLKMTIQEKSILVERGDYFGVLGLNSSADGAEVQKAYFVLAKTFHPDKLAQANLEPDDLKKGRRVFEFMTEAFNILSDPAKRKSVAEGKLSGGASPSRLPRGDDAQIFLHQGLKMIRMRAWDKAEEFLRKAVQRDGQNVQMLSNLGWAVFNNPTKKESVRLEEARGIWEQGLKVDPKDGHTNYLISLYYKSVKKSIEQERHLKAALDADEDMVDAQREMRLLKMRKGKNSGGDGILAKLFPSFVKKS